MYDKILVPVDGSATSRLGLAEAIKLGKLTGARLKLIHCVDLLSVSLSPEISMAASPTLFDRLREGGEEMLAKAKATAAQAGVPCDTLLVDSLTGRERRRELRPRSAPLPAHLRADRRGRSAPARAGSAVR